MEVAWIYPDGNVVQIFLAAGDVAVAVGSDGPAA